MALRVASVNQQERFAKPPRRKSHVSRALKQQRTISVIGQERRLQGITMSGMTQSDEPNHPERSSTHLNARDIVLQEVALADHAIIADIGKCIAQLIESGTDPIELMHLLHSSNELSDQDALKSWLIRISNRIRNET